MPVAITRGARGTSTLAPEQKKVVMDQAIKHLVPDETVFTTLTQQIGKEKVGFPEFKSMEDDLLPRFDQATGAVSAGATTLGVQDLGKFNQNDTLIHTLSGEVLIVNAAVTGAGPGNLTVARGSGTNTIAIGDEILLAGSAQPEGDDARAPTSINPIPVIGMTQILRRSWQLTGTSYASENETTPQDWDYQAARVGIEHKRDIERTLLFNGAPVNVGGAGQPKRLSMGLLWSIKSNQQAAGGGYTEDEFNVFSRMMFRYGSKKRVLMASPLAAAVLNSYPMSKVRISQSEKRYGINVTTFVSPFGELSLVVNWELDGSKWGGAMVAYDPANVKFCYLANAKANRDSHVNTEIQNPGNDSREDEWLTECGLKVNLEKTSGLVTGITGP